VLILKKMSKPRRNIEELIVLDAKRQPHSIFQKRIVGAK
jgi:hypothetical protein